MRRGARSLAALAVAALALTGSHCATCFAQADAPVETFYTGEPISIPVKERRLIEHLRIFVEVSGLSIAADKEIVQRIVTFGVANEPWDQALDRLFDGQGLTQRPSGGTLLVEPREASLPLRRQGCFFERPSADPARPDCVVVTIAVGTLSPEEIARRGLEASVSALRRAPCAQYAYVAAVDDGNSPCSEASLELAIDPGTTREAWILEPGIRSRKDLLKVHVVRGDSPWPADLKVMVTQGSSSLCVEGLISGSTKPILLRAETKESEAVFVQVRAEPPPQ